MLRARTCRATSSGGAVDLTEPRGGCTGPHWSGSSGSGGAELRIDPCVPREWRSFEIEFRYRRSVYHIVVQNPASRSKGVLSVELDGGQLAGSVPAIPLLDDGVRHVVRVLMGP